MAKQTKHDEIIKQTLLLIFLVFFTGYLIAIAIFNPVMFIILDFIIAAVLYFVFLFALAKIVYNFIKDEKLFSKKHFW
ncbi:MAG: hypothetical protein QXH07_02405 [Thermoplasmata archaeon]